MTDIDKKHELWLDNIYSWLQVEDCAAGSPAIKRKNELYLPIPAGFLMIENSSDVVATEQRSRSGSELINSNAPFEHPNRPYQSYLQRARFPDIVNDLLRGFLGLITSQDAEIDIPSSVAYLEDQASLAGMGLDEFYVDVVAKILCTGKVSIVVDTRSDGTVYFIAYSAASNIDWDAEYEEGDQVITRSVFVDSITDSGGQSIRGYKEYTLAPLADDESLNPVLVYQVNEYDNDKKLVRTKTPMIRGRMLNELPIISVGSVKNTIEPDVIPLLGVSDIALTIYRENADLHHAHYMTCNPTLIMFGVDAEEVPRTVGSGVAIGISDPSASAMYPATDTSALEHIRTYIKDLFAEATNKGSKFLADRKSAESAEAVRRRESAQSTDLIHIVKLSGRAVEDAINFALIWLEDASAGEAIFTPSTEFGRLSYSAQEIQALVAGWLQGSISHDTVLDRFRDAGIVDEDITNDEERTRIQATAPVIPETVEKDDDEEDDEEDLDDDEEESIG